MQGDWTNNTKYNPHDADYFTAACSIPDKVTPSGRREWGKDWTGTLAKCVELWSMNDGANRLTACIHMARAAYQGLGYHTYPGTWVDAYDYDANPPHPPPPPHHSPGCTSTEPEPDWAEDRCDMWVEATWDEKGAVCVSHARYDNMPPEISGGVPKDSYFTQMIFTERKIDAGTRDDFAMICRPDAQLGNPVSKHLGAVAPAILSNRSVHHKDKTTAVDPPLDQPRGEWDDPEAVNYCPPVAPAPH